MDFISKDPNLITQPVYEAFQDNLAKYLPSDKPYREDDVWNLLCYKVDRQLTFEGLIREYEKYSQDTGVTAQVVSLFRALRTNSARPNPDPPRKSVTVRVNVDLYYEIDTTHLPTWMSGDVVTKAVEEAFGDAGALTFASLTAAIKQAPSEVIINKFVYDH